MEEALIAATAISFIFCIVVAHKFELLGGTTYTGGRQDHLDRFDYNTPCHVGLPDDLETALFSGALPAANGSSSTLPKVGLCTMMTLEYEEHTLLHWVAYHHLLGFDAIWIYMDDRTGGLAGSQRRALHRIVLQLPPEVTLRYVSMTPGVTRQPESVEHCLRAARADGFDWIAHWDGDEYPVLGPPVTANEQLQASPFDVKKMARERVTSTAQPASRKRILQFSGRRPDPADHTRQCTDEVEASGTPRASRRGVWGKILRRRAQIPCRLSAARSNRRFSRRRLSRPAHNPQELCPNRS